MSALALVHSKGEPRADTRVLAAGLRNQHKAVMALVERYADRFKSFGLLPFQMEAVKEDGARGSKHQRFALLNEDQSFFLLSLSRNTEHVVDLKARLVMAFKEARAGQQAQSLEYLPGYHALHDRAHDLAKNSTNEKFVHMNLNKLVNRTVGIESGQRPGLPPAMKSRIVVAQELAVMAMQAANDHHDGYAKAKEALGALGNVLRLKN